MCGSDGSSWVDDGRRPQVGSTRSVTKRVRTCSEGSRPHIWILPFRWRSGLGYYSTSQKVVVSSTQGVRHAAISRKTRVYGTPCIVLATAELSDPA